MLSNFPPQSLPTFSCAAKLLHMKIFAPGTMSAASATIIMYVQIVFMNVLCTESFWSSKTNSCLCLSRCQLLKRPFYLTMLSGMGTIAIKLFFACFLLQMCACVCICVRARVFVYLYVCVSDVYIFVCVCNLCVCACVLIGGPFGAGPSTIKPASLPLLDSSSSGSSTGTCLQPNELGFYARAPLLSREPLMSGMAPRRPASRKVVSAALNVGRRAGRLSGEGASEWRRELLQIR